MIHENGNGTEKCEYGNMFISQENIKPQLESISGLTFSDDEYTAILNILQYQHTEANVVQVEKNNDICTWLSEVYSILPMFLIDMLYDRTIVEQPKNNKHTIYYSMPVFASPKLLMEMSEKIQTNNIQVEKISEMASGRIIKCDQPINVKSDDLVNITALSVYDDNDPNVEASPAMRYIQMVDIRKIIRNLKIQNRDQKSILEFEFFSTLDEQFHPYTIDIKDVEYYNIWRDLICGICELDLEEKTKDNTELFKGIIRSIKARAGRNTDTVPDDYLIIITAIEQYAKNGISYSWRRKDSSTMTKEERQNTIIYDENVDPDHMLIPVQIFKHIQENSPETKLTMYKKQLGVEKSILMGTGNNRTYVWKVPAEPFLSWKYYHDQNKNTKTGNIPWK